MRGHPGDAVRGVFALLLATTAIGIERPAPRHPLLIVEPTMNGDPVGQPPDGGPGREACLNPTLWPSVWERMDLFGQAIQFFTAPAWSDADLSQCFANLRRAGKGIVVAAGALKPHCATGRACWDAVRPGLVRLRARGAEIAYVEIDEPLTTGGQPSYDIVLRETGAFIQEVREEFPDVRIIVQEAYPHQTASTLARFFLDVHELARATTGEGIQYAQLDHDWARGGTAEEVAAIQRSLADAGVKFGVIFWRADPSMTWEAGLRRQGELYREYRLSGVEPDMYAVINWTGAPDRTLPEWPAGGRHPFMSAVREFTGAFVPPSAR